MDKEDREMGWIKERWIRKTGRWAGSKEDVLKSYCDGSDEI